MNEALALAHKLAALPPQSLQETKRALNVHLQQAVASVLPFALSAEAESFAHSRDQSDDRASSRSSSGVREVRQSCMARTNEFKLTGEVRSPAKTMGPRALRTSGLIKERAREVFLAKGYYGTSVEEIAEAAGVSRASFYTYFPSKRDLLYSLGTDTYSALDGTSNEMRALEPTWSNDDVYEIVRIYLRFLEEHGAFMLVWSQATYGDERARQGRDAHPTGERAPVRPDASSASPARSRS